MDREIKIGIMSAMQEEIFGVIHFVEDRSEKTIGMRTYYTGKINAISVVVVFSRWGKVAAATTVSTLIENFGITELIFTGVAGAVDCDLNIGDIVLGKQLVQHDMDARPLMKRFEVPLLNKIFFETNPVQLSVAAKAIEALLDAKVLNSVIAKEVLQQFKVVSPKLVVGDIASGDQFFSSADQKHILHAALPSVVCVEMEGAAVAQVCFEHDIPFTVIRTISDIADDNAHIDFPRFVQNVASMFATEIIKNILK